MSEKQTPQVASSELPKAGEKYWWFSGESQLWLLTVEKLSAKKGIDIELKVFRGYSANTQNVWWTKQEWEAAVQNHTLFQFVPPVTEKDLAENEAICDSCRGTRWEIERDGCILACVWCNWTGKKEKRTPPEPTHTQRSPLHPPIPIKKK